MSRWSPINSDFKITSELSVTLAERPFIAAWTIGSLLALLGYWLIFTWFGALSSTAAIRVAGINVATAFVLGCGANWLLQRQVLHLRAPWQILLQPVLAGAFSLAWYIFNISAQGWAAGSLTSGTRILPFTGPAFIWQMFQGLVVYGAVAATSAWANLRLRMAQLTAAPQSSAQASASSSTVARSLLVRNGDEIQSVDVDDVNVITAAGDYAELVTSNRRILIRKSLSDLAGDLPGFVRVHRSHLVNVDRLVRAEPGGAGRLILHLSGGETIVASRSGARLIRERAF